MVCHRAHGLCVWMCEELHTCSTFALSLHTRLLSCCCCHNQLGSFMPLLLVFFGMTSTGSCALTADRSKARRLRAMHWQC